MKALYFRCIGETIFEISERIRNKSKNIFSLIIIQI